MRDVFEGIRDGLLFTPLYFPLAVPYAIAAQTVGLADWQIVLWSALLFAAASQLACLSALAGGAGLLELLVVTLMANARHGLMAMALARYYAGVKRGLLPVFAFTLTAPTLGLLPSKARRGGNLSVYGLATQLCQWIQWITFTFFGLWLGPLMPPSWGPIIAFAVPAAFIGLLSPMIREDLRAGLIVLVMAVSLGLGLTYFWPPQICAIVGALAGSLAASFMPQRQSGSDGT